MRIIVEIDRRRYDGMLWNSRDGRFSGFVAMRTWPIGMCFLPAWMIVSSVYVKRV
jgi:hypothetical protein